MMNYYDSLRACFKTPLKRTWQKKLAMLAFFIMFGVLGVQAQVVVTVTNPTNTTPNLAPSYTSLSNALTSLNSVTGMSGPVTLTLAAGSETAPAAGFVVGSTSLNAVLSSTNTVSFVASGTVVLNAPVGGATPTSASPDGIFKITGADYITLDGITFTDGNTANPATMEFGVGLFKLSVTDGANNNTIKNCIFNMQRINNASSTAPMVEGAVGILMLNATAAAATTALTPTAASGANSNNKFYSNSINGGNYGIALIGYAAPSPFTLADTGNDIGGSSLSTGNSILNFGGAASATNPAAAVRTLAQYGLNVSYNTINNNNGSGVNHVSTLRGIYTNTATSASATINNNTVTITCGATTSQISGIENVSGSTAASNSISINNNTLVMGYPTATSGIQYGIYNTASPANLNINNNTITNTTAATSASQYPIFNSGTPTVAININGNTISQTMTAASTSATVRGIYCSSAGSSSAMSISSNNINALSYTGATGGTGETDAIYQTGTPLTEIVSNNNFNNLTIKTSGAVYMIYNNYTAPATAGASKTIQNNAIVTQLSRTVAGTNLIAGYYDNASSTTAMHTISGNNFSNITNTATGSSTMYGIYSTDYSGNPGLTVFNNTVSNLTQSGTGALYGIYVGGYAGTSGTPNEVYNNTVTGINSSSTSTTQYGLGISQSLFVNVYNNTIQNNTFSGTGAQFIGLYNGSGGTNKFFNNTVTNLTGSSTAVVIGVLVGGGTTTEIYQNKVNTLSGASSVWGIYVNGGTTTNIYDQRMIGANNYSVFGLSSSGATSLTEGLRVGGGTTTNLYRNNVYDLTNTSSSTSATFPPVHGLGITAGTTVNAYNNLISRLTAPAVSYVDAIRGISVNSTTAASSYNIYNNTILLNASSTGTNFGTTGIFHAASATATTAALDLRNNIVINTSTPSGTGVTTVLRRSAAATLGNFATTSNRNMYYAGTPSATNTILYEGTTGYQTFANYYAAVGPTRDANSFENGGYSGGGFFASTTPTAANYLQPANAFVTQAESGGSIIPLFNTDFNGATRSGTNYDIGAWEFTGVTPAPVITLTSVTPPLTPQCVKTNRVVVVDISTASGTVTGAVLNYSHNGVAQPAITMTNTSGSSWTGTMLTPTTGNATVSWTVTATNSLGINSVYSGTNYADEPNTGVIATAAPSLSTVCSGSPTVLTAAFSKAVVATVGAGASTTTDYPNPFYSSWSHSQQQILVRASELTAAGLGAGKISAITMAVTAGTTNMPDFSLSMQNTSLTSLSTLTTTGWTTVYTNATGFTPVVGNNTITFSAPYTWDGTSNILLKFCWGNSSTTATQSNTMKTDATSYVCSINAHNSSATSGTSICSNSTVYLTYSQRPQFVFTADLAPTPTAYSWVDSNNNVVGTTNPLTVNPIANGTYTVTATANGCPITATTPMVTINPLPTSPTATNSAQCGTQIPTASVADSNGYSTPTFKWYAASSGGTALQSSTSTTYASTVSATTTFYVAVVNPTTSCESLRTPITINVSTPDSISATPSSPTICLGSPVTLTAANTNPTPVQSYTYSWYSATVGSGATSPVSGNPAVITPTIAGTYTYTVTGTDGGCSTTNTVSVTVGAAPPVTVSTPAPICAGASVTLTATSGAIGSGNVNLGAGASTISGTTTGFGNPYNHWYGGMKTQYIYTKAELNAAGITAGNISALAFETTVLGSSTLTMANFTISIGHTTQSVATTNLITSGLTQVYSNVAQGVTLGINNYAFSTPFNWNNTDNIVVSVSWSTVDGGSTSQSATVKGDNTATSLTSILYADSTTAANFLAATNNTSTGIGTTNNNAISVQRPKVRFSATTNIDNTASYNWTWNPGNIAGNSITVSPGSTTVYTVTAQNPTTLCTTDVPVTVTVNPLPTAPVGTNSTQCGTKAPSASVADPNGFTTPTFKWYAASSGGTALQSSTSTTYTTVISSSTNFYVSVVNPSTGCESTRTLVTVTFVPADAITITPSSSTPCVNSPFTLGASSTNTGYVYTWTASPAAGSGIPTTMTGNSISVTPTVGGTYVYTASGTDGSCSASNTVSISVVSPTVVATASNATICNGKSTTLTATTPTVGTGTTPVGAGATTETATSPYRNGANGAKLQYLYTAAELTAGGVYPGNLTSLTYFITSLGSPVALSNYQIAIANTTATSLGTTFDASPSTVVYGPTAYTTVAGNNVHIFTTPFNWDGTSNIVITICHETPSAFSSSTVKADAVTGKSTGVISFSTGSQCATAAGATTSPNRPWAVFGGQVATFGAGSLVYTWNPGALSGNSVTVTPSSTTTYTVSAFDSVTGCTATKDVVVTVNPLPTPPVATNSSQCGAKVPTASVADVNGFTTPTFKWYADNVTTTALQSSTSTTYTTSISATTTFYVSVTNPTTGCESTRTAVTVTYTAPDAIVRNPGATATGCSNQPLVVSVSSTNTNYVYTWTASPAAGSGIATSVTGASPSITPTGAGSYTYTISATDGNCTTSTTIVATINQAPSALTITQGSPTVCTGNVISLTANGGTLPSLSVSEAFTGSTLPSGWTATMGSGDTFSISATATAGGTANEARIVGNSQTANIVDRLSYGPINTVGLTSLPLQWNNYVNHYQATYVYGVKVQTSTDGVTWHDTSWGTSPVTAAIGPGVQNTVISTSDVGSATLYIAFTATGQTFGFHNWNIDNVSISIPSTPPAKVWTPITDLYTDAAATTAYTGGDASVLYAKANSAITYTVTASNGSCSTTATTSLSPLPLPTFTVAPATICKGGAGTTLNAVGSGNTYSWSPAAGLSATSGASVVATPTATTTYTVTATNNTTGCQSQQTTTVTVNTPASISSISPANPSAINGQTVVITAVAAGTGITYQWYESQDGGGSFNPISGETGNTLTIVADSSMNGYLYHVVVTGTAPCGSVTSADALLTVDTTGITEQPQNLTVCAPGSAVFSVVATSEDEEQEITYGWEVNTGSGFIPISDGADTTLPGYTFSGSETNTLTLVSTTPVSPAPNWVFHAVINGYINSDDAVLVVNAPVNITSMTSSQTVCAGADVANFTVAATGTGLTYQWQVSTNGGSSYANVSNGSGVTGATSATLTLTNMPASANGNLYQVVVSGASPCGPMTSAAGTLNVTNVVISTQPANAIAIVPGTVNFTVATTAPTPTYQWQYATTAGGSYSNVVNGTPAGVTYSGATSASLSVTTSATTPISSNYYYKVVVTSTGCPVTSSAAQMDVRTYCLPTYADGPGTATNSFADMIAGVSLGTLNNTSGGSTTSPYYTFYDTVTIPSIAQLSTAQISVKFGPDTANYCAVWIDFNQNGVFEASEGVVSTSTSAGVSTNGGTTILSLPVPITALTGNTRMRVRGGDDVALTTAQACGASNDVDGESEDYIVNITAAPACSGTPTAAVITSSVPSICQSGTATLTATGYTTGQTGISLQWYNSAGLIASANGATYTTPTLTSSETYYVRTICANGGGFANSNSVTITVNNPQVVSTVPGTRCGTGTVNLSAVGSAGSTLTWYAASSGGSPLFTGTNFTTPSISANTTYYVAANTGGGSETNGKPSSPGTDGNYIGTATGLVFNVTSPVTLSSTVIYPVGTGTVTIALYNSAGTELMSTAAIAVTGTGASTPVTVPLNFVIPNGTGYRLFLKAYTGLTGLLRDSTGVTFPYNSTNTSITSGYILGTSTSYYFFYNLQFSSGCTSARTAVAATVTPAPALTLSPTSATVCAGTPTSKISITSPVGNFDNYVWNPSTGVTGSAASGYTFTASASTVYTLTATNASGCVNTATFTLNVNPLPVDFAVTPSSTTSCQNGAPVLLTANGGDVPSTVFTEGANVLPTTFTVSNTSGTGTATLNSTYSSEGSGSVLFATSSTSADVRYAMNSNINLTGATSATLTFDHIAAMEGYLNTYDYGYVQYSTDGGANWVSFPTTSYAGSGTLYNSVVSFTTLSYPEWTAALQGASAVPNNTLWKSETINIPAAALASSQFRVRFRYTTDSSTNYYGWLIDNIKISKVGSSTITWAPTAGLYTNAAGTVAYAGGAATTVYAKPASTTAYTATATASGTGCTATSVSTITVNPTPTATAPANMNLCAGSLSSAVTLTGTPSGVIFNITGGSAVGLNDQSGVTSIPAFTTIAGTATVSITPFANGCTGTPVTFTVNVAPETVGGAVTGAGPAACQGATSGLLTLSGHTGTVVRWESSVAPYSVWTPIANTATTYTSGPLTQTTQFRAVVKSGACIEVASASATVTINSVTLSSISSPQVCANAETTITMNGLVPNSTSTVTFSRGGITQPTVVVIANAVGVGSFNVLVTGASQNITILSIQRTDSTPSCTLTPSSGNSITLVNSTGCTSLSICGWELVNIDQTIIANIVANAQAYRWRVTRLEADGVTPTTEVQFLDSALRTMKLVQLSQYRFNTYYRIEVATMRANVWGPYGQACNVHTPATTTTLMSCGTSASPTVITNISDIIYANLVPYAAGYRFRITDPITPSNTQVLDRNVREFRMNLITAFTVQYNKNYNVEVAVKNTDGTYLPYQAVACVIKTPQFPTTSVQDSQCDDYLVPGASTQIYAYSYPGAIAYAFQLTGPTLAGGPNYPAGVEVVKSTRAFTVNDFPGLIPGATYVVKVRLIFNLTDPAGPYGKACSIVAPGTSRPVIEEVTFNAVAYPNPFADNFNIDVTTATESVVNVKVYDMTGRLLETHNVNVADMETLKVGDRFPSGVYNVIVTQDENVRTLRVVKR